LDYCLWHWKLRHLHETSSIERQQPPVIREQHPHRRHRGGGDLRGREHRALPRRPFRPAACRHAPRRNSELGVSRRQERLAGWKRFGKHLGPKLAVVVGRLGHLRARNEPRLGHLWARDGPRRFRASGQPYDKQDDAVTSHAWKTISPGPWNQLSSLRNRYIDPTCRSSQRPAAQMRKCGDGGGRSLSRVGRGGDPDQEIQTRVAARCSRLVADVIGRLASEPTAPAGA